MKRLVIVLVSVGMLIVGAMYFLSNSEEYIAPKIVEKEVQIKVDSLDQRIEEAQDAAQVEIEQKAKAAYDSVYEDEMRVISDEIKKKFIEEVEATITDESY